MKIITKFLVTFLTVFFIWSCNSDEVPTNDITKNIVLKSGQIYIYDFNILGDEEGATIITQPKHADISEIIRDATTNWSVVYRYKPVDGYTGSDSVEIKTCTGSDGTNCGETKLYLIEFEIRN
ncbi:MAG: hypothetical protein R2757_17720 [Draconibacterium sp.]|jgi:hypothetical protein